MSNYQGFAYNPKTDLVERVQFLDDHFGKHEYGVRFSENEIYPASEVLILQEKDEDSYRTFYRGDIYSFNVNETSLIEACRSIKDRADRALSQKQGSF